MILILIIFNFLIVSQAIIFKKGGGSCQTISDCHYGGECI